MKKRIVLLVFIMSHCFSEALAQALQVTGRVTSKATGEPLSGATITVKGTSTVTTADQNGNFSIAVSQGALLKVSYAGMADQELSVDKAGTLNFALEEKGGLNEVVVVGYGQQRKSLVTGAISSVKAEQLATVSSTRIDQALQGRTAGVVILPTSGQPGAGLNVRIRGAGSNRNSNPLYIIDGVRADGIEYIDPSEVASIEILKDAASAAIYGAEGANGVIIITTKTGKKNSSEVSYQTQFARQSVKDNIVKMMNPQQYQQYLQEAGVISGAPKPSDVAGMQGTNWMKEVLQTAPQQHHTLSFSGGGDKSSYFISGNLFTQEGIVGGDKSRFNRYTVRFNSDHRIRPWLSIGNRVSYSHHRRKAISDNNEFGSILGSALVMDPTTPVTYTNGILPAHVQKALADGKPLRRDANGNIYGISNYLKGEFGNPLARIDIAKGENIQNKIVGNVFADIEPFKGFKFTTRFGLDAAFQVGHGWTPTFWFSDESQNSIANAFDYNNNWFTWQWENFATYQKKIGEHNVVLLAGASAQKTQEFHMGGSYSGLFKEEDKFSYAANVPDDLDRIGSIGFNRTLASFFGRISYDYNNKYLLNATLRRDGSSLFASGYQWGTFPSVSAGWVVSNESFFPESVSNVMNYVKLRGSWGRNGSLSAVGLGEWMNSIGSNIIYPDGSDVLQVGAAPTSLANPELTWETSEQFDIGADFGFLNNRLTLTVDYFKKTTKDLLTGGTAPRFAGNILRTVNAGDVVNKGLEFELGYKNPARTSGGFTYDVSVNFTSLDNEVTFLDPNTPVIPGALVGTGWTATSMKVGQPLWYFSGYKTAGIFQSQAEINNYISKNGLTGYSPNPGESIVVDINNDKIISEADMTYIGSPHPDYLFGGRINVGFKGFDLLLFAQGQAGNDILMGFNRTDRATANKPLFFYNNRWTGEGSTNSWFASNTGNPHMYNSDFMIFDGSFMRIRQLQLGYTLPPHLTQKLKIKNARIYASLDDFFTFTKYPGVDPEGGSNGQNSIGIDRGGYPVPRKAIAGLSFSF